MQDYKVTNDRTEILAEETHLSELLTLLSAAVDDPVEGLAGYLVTEDPTYLPEDTEIKMMIRTLGRDRLLRLILARVLAVSGACNVSEED